MRIPLLALASAAAATAATFDQHPWHSFYSAGKPQEMLQVGRYPHLGCTSSLRKQALTADNTWNAYACDINETVVLENAKFINETGLLQAGYEYFVIDDCWMAKERSKEGYLVPDIQRFPSGIKALVDAIHGLGLKFGIYESAGYLTCQRLPGSLGYEDKDAELFTSWGVDYLKYDNCARGPDVWQARYNVMRDALLKYWKQPILYALCEWGEDEVWKWGNETGHTWRISGDIKPYWDRIAWIAEIQSRTWMYSGPYGYGDMDMLEVGNGDLTIYEQRTHFNLWALSKSPLLIGTHLPSLPQSSLDILLNPYILQINQDSLSHAVSPFSPSPLSPFSTAKMPTHWSGPLGAGETVLMIINPFDRPLSFQFNWREIPGFKDSPAMLFYFAEISTRNIWRSGSRVGFIYRNVPAHGSIVMVVWEYGKVVPEEYDQDFVEAEYS